MKPPIRIAILECDTPVPKAHEKYGGYGDIFTTLLKAGADAYGHPDVVSSKQGLEFSIYDAVKQEYPSDLEKLDAVLLSGSKHNSFDNDEWILKLVSYTEQLLKQDRVRIIGVCFGHQIIGRAMGAKVGRSDLGWEISASIIKTTDKGKELFGKDLVTIHQMHRDAVFEWPEGVEKLATSPRCEVQGMYVKNKLISVQGHPEFNSDIMTELVEVRKGMGLFDQEMYDDAMARAKNSHDGVAISRAFIQFLVED